MKIEVRCPACGKAYLVDPAKVPPAGGVVACVACGASIAIGAPASLEPAAPPTAGPAPRPTLPRAAAPEPPAEVVCPRCALHFIPDRTRPKAPEGARARILVVEDMPYFLEIARDALSERYDVCAASTVDEGLRVLAGGGIDLILLDLTLQNGEDGLRLLREMRVKRCPVLLFTAQDESEMYGDGWERVRDLGIDDVVFKGMNMAETLVRKVGVLLGEVESPSTGLR